MTSAGRGLVAAEVRRLGVDRPRLGVSHERRPSRYLTVDGVPAFQVGYSCGTCGHVLRRQPGAEPGGASPAEVRDLLAAGLDGLDERVIDAFSAQLPRGDYLVLLLDVVPRLVAPGSPDDYFAVEGPAAWRDAEHEEAIDPANTGYYRLPTHRVDEHDTLFGFVIPMSDPQNLDVKTLSRYAVTPAPPTAVSFGLLDVEGPHFRREQHWALSHFLLDGHHKTAAAAGAGRPSRLLSFVSAAESCATADQLRQLPTILGN